MNQAVKQTMTQANDNYDTNRRKLNDNQVCDTNERTEKQDSSPFKEETDEDDIPSSLLSYFQSSKSRAAVCEKLILEEPEDFFASHHTEDRMTVNEQVFCDPETSVNNSSSDNHLLRAPPTQDWPDSEGEAETGDHEEVEESLMLETKLLDVPLGEEVKKEELWRQTEDDFQKELKRIREAEKRQQNELELMEKKAQEKLEQELQLQQEVISGLQRRVEEERKRIEEEQRRLKDEEEQRMKKEAERKRVEEAERRKKDEERKKEEMKLKQEEEKKKIEAEQRRLKEEEEKKRVEEERRRKEDEERKIEEMKLKQDAERKKIEEEQRRLKKEEERKRMKKDEERKIEEIKLKKEEERKKVEEEKRRMEMEEKKGREKEKKKLEDEMRLMKKKEEKEKRDEEKRRTEEVRRMEREERKREEEMIQEEKERRKIKEENFRLEEELKKRKAGVKEEEKTQRKEKEDERKEDRKREEGKHEVVSEKRRCEGEMGEKKRERKKEGEMILKMNEETERKTITQEEMNKDEGKRGETGNQGEEEVRRDERREEEEKKDGEEEQRREKGERKTDEGEETVRLIGEEDHEKSGDGKKLQGFDVDERKEEDKKDEERKKEEEESGNQAIEDKGEEVSLTGEDELREKEMDEISSNATSLPVFLPEHAEQKRLSWMKECTSWSKLSLQNRRKQKVSHQEGRQVRRAGEVSGRPPLCADLLLQSPSWKSLKEVTSVTLEDLPGCSLSTLSQCSQLQSLTLRRCGLRSLEGINQLPQLSYIDVQENEISFIDCENLTSLRVLNLNHNKLTSIHGLTGAENLEALELSHNSITRIAGLESMKRLQKLSLDHNQLISTKGLKDVYTLLHLDCSHNHLLRVEGVESCGLLSTLDLRANSLTEPPALNNHVLLRDLRLDDNSIWSLQSLADCWLPLLQRLSAAQNRLTQLPSLSDAVSLSFLDLRFNCLSELQNVTESLETCLLLRELHLTGNPLQQEGGWRASLRRALPGLKAIDDQQTDSSLSPPAVQQVSLHPGSFLALCQAHLQQTQELEQRHSRELSEAFSPLDAVKASCRHFSEALQLAVDQRFAHEYGDTSVPDQHKAAGQTADKLIHTQDLEMEFTGNTAPVILNRNVTGCNYWTSEGKSAGGIQEVVPVSNLHQNAAVVIQQLWRKYKQKCGNITGGEPESGSAVIKRKAAGNDYAATVIQALWRGYALRRRLASALAAVTCSDTGEDDTFEEVDVDEFVFDEAALEKDWTPLPEDPPSRCVSVSEQQLSLELPEPSRYILPPQHVWRSKQAWVDEEREEQEEQEDFGGQRVSPASSVRSKPPLTPVPSGLAEKSEKILEEWGFTQSHTALMMLRRAQKMKSKKQQPKKRRDPSAHWTLFRNCSYQGDPAGAQKRRGNHNRNYVKECGEDELSANWQERRCSIQEASTLDPASLVLTCGGPPSSGSIPSARGLACPAQPSLRSPTGANVSGSESSPFWRPPPDVLEESWRSPGGGWGRMRGSGGGLWRDESEIISCEVHLVFLSRAGGEVELERVKQDRAQQWLHAQAAQAAQSDRDSESLHFLPELSAGVLNGGRVQLVADPGYSERQHHGSGLWAKSRESSSPHSNASGHTKKEIPSPKRDSSAPSKKERISFRDNPVQLSGGWGGGKKRDRVLK
ncbi:uncharacterized protein lrriq1 [Halichoeres trimaculatus]|uniref:uncharacterized protein lrriq1 n=1 Tax=Halichoeres trimaculatus TaxID=147232 RepID=UPI003D9DC839